MATIDLPEDCRAIYDPIRELKRGGFGVLILARHRNLGRLAALKLLDPDGSREPDDVNRFLQEARLTASLRSDHIVEVHDVGRDHVRPWIAYEYLEGQDLVDLVRHGPLPDRQVRLIGLQMARALQEAHAHGVIHRDVKLENILEVSPALYKLLDFGIARCAGGSAVRTAHGLVLGTPGYMAPEQILRSGVDATSDLYALGVVLYHLLAGRPPFDYRDPLTLLQAHLKEEPPSLRGRCPGVDPALAAVVHRLLEKNPKNRPPSAAALADELMVEPSGLVDLMTREIPVRDRTAPTATGPAAGPTPTRALPPSRPGLTRADSGASPAPSAGLPRGATGGEPRLRPPGPVPDRPDRPGIHRRRVGLAVTVIFLAGLLWASRPAPDRTARVWLEGCQLGAGEAVITLAATPPEALARASVTLAPPGRFPVAMAPALRPGFRSSSSSSLSLTTTTIAEALLATLADLPVVLKPVALRFREIAKRFPEGTSGPPPAGISDDLQKVLDGSDIPRRLAVVRTWLPAVIGTDSSGTVRPGLLRRLHMLADLRHQGLRLGVDLTTLAGLDPHELEEPGGALRARGAPVPGRLRNLTPPPITAASQPRDSKDLVGFLADLSLKPPPDWSCTPLRLMSEFWGEEVVQQQIVAHHYPETLRLMLILDAELPAAPTWLALGCHAYSRCSYRIRINGGRELRIGLKKPSRMVDEWHVWTRLVDPSWFRAGENHIEIRALRIEPATWPLVWTCDLTLFQAPES